MSEEKRFEKDDVIAIPDGKGGLRPALITRIGGDGTTADRSTVNYCFIDSQGNLDAGGYFRGEHEMKEVKLIDFAHVRTVVDLPPEWQKLAFDYEMKTEEAQRTSRRRSGEEMPETHPSYGAFSVHRVNGDTPLFGSPFRHHNYITVSIGRAERHRHLGKDYHFAGLRGELIEISMSESQWARAISSVGLGGGIPCTLEYVGMKRQERCPEQQEVKRFNDEIRKTTAEASSFLEEAEAAMEALLNDKAPTKEKRKQVLELLSTARRRMQDSAPFVVEQLGERMDTIIQDGKTEIEAFANATIVEAGLVKLAETLGKDTRILGPMSVPPTAPKLIDINAKKAED